MKSKSETVTKSLKNDVLPGSRYEANTNPGNKFYKQQLLNKKDKYRRAMDVDTEANREVRKNLARKVYYEVTKIRNGRKGRFLGFKSGDIKKFVVMNEADALQKIHKDFKKVIKSKSNSNAVKKRALDESHDHVVSAKEMAHLAKEIANKEVENALKNQVKYIKGKTKTKNMKRQHNTVQSTASQIEMMMADAGITKEKMRQLKSMLEVLRRNEEELEVNVKKGEELEDTVTKQQILSPNERVAIAAQRELTTEPNLSAERKANLRAVIKKLSENDPLMSHAVNTEWQRNPSSRFLSTRALDNTMVVCCPSSRSVLLDSIPSLPPTLGFARMPSVPEYTEG